MFLHTFGIHRSTFAYKPIKINTNGKCTNLSRLRLATQ